MNVEEKVIEILSELSGAGSVKPQHTLIGDLGLNSLSMVMMLIEFESFFNIEFKESDMNPYAIITVADAVSLVERYL